VAGKAAAAAQSKGTPAAAKAADATPAKASTDSVTAKPVAAAEAHQAPAGKRAKGVPTKRKKHGTAYRWMAAYLPLLAALFGILAIVWVYSSFIRQPSPDQRWTALESKWSGPRELARVAVGKALVAAPFDLTAEKAAYKDFATQTKGWLDEAAGVSDWGGAKDAVAKFESDGKLLMDQLNYIAASTSQADIGNSYYTTLGVADRTVTADIQAIETAVGLAPSASAIPVPELPAPTPQPDTPAPSGSAAPSATPVATPAPTPSPAPSLSAVPSAS
jgi:hypothetical protein